MVTENASMKPKEKWFAAAKLALFVVAIVVPARLLTIETATIEDEWHLYVGLFTFVACGLYLTFTLAIWVGRRWGRN
jgi:hypothetical protein